MNNAQSEVRANEAIPFRAHFEQASLNEPGSKRNQRPLTDGQSEEESESRGQEQRLTRISSNKGLRVMIRSVDPGVSVGEHHQRV